MKLTADQWKERTLKAADHLRAAAHSLEMATECRGTDIDHAVMLVESCEASVAQAAPHIDASLRGLLGQDIPTWKPATDRRLAQEANPGPKLTVIREGDPPCDR